MSRFPGEADAPRVAALGGGHGLHASLSALLRLQTRITAIVTVADDGGSSGRIRRELDVLPPGDLRMALSALADRPVGPGSAPDRLGWDELLQYRLGGSGPLAGHAVGNLLLTGLLELRSDPVQALDLLGAIVGARGRVLPMAAIPLDLMAEVGDVANLTEPDRTPASNTEPPRHHTIRGQNAIAEAGGTVRDVWLVPSDPPACAEAVTAILEADVVFLGPGSWFTSVLPHLLVPELAAALTETRARIVTILNLAPQVGETAGFTPQDHLAVLLRHCPALRLDAIIADSDAVTDPDQLRSFANSIGATLVTAPVAEARGVERHDPGRLSRAIGRATGLRPVTDAVERTTPVIARLNAQQGAP